MLELDCREEILNLRGGEGDERKRGVGLCQHKIKASSGIRAIRMGDLLQQEVAR